VSRSLAVAAAVAVAACSPKFDPASRIEKLRVVAIRAEPPEIDPAGVATLTSLVLRADFAAAPSRTTTVVHLACVPVPGDPSPTPCVALENLIDPAAMIGDAARQGCAAGSAEGNAPWPAVDLAGIEACVGTLCGPASAGGAALPPARLTVPAAFAFPATGPERILGVQAVDLAFALDATPDELVAGVGTVCPAGDVAANLARLWAEREHVLSTKRVVIGGPDAPAGERNHNPAVAGILAGGTALEPAGATTLAAGSTGLAPEVPVGPAGQPEVYTQLDAAGVPIGTGPEQWVYSWFATAGDLDLLHTHPGETDRWSYESVRGPVRIAVVVRDLRGGTAWAVRDVQVR
jgi:hypothetical protein